MWVKGEDIDGHPIIINLDFVTHIKHGPSTMVLFTPMVLPDSNPVIFYVYDENAIKLIARLDL